MSAPTSKRTASGDAREAPALLKALARAPAALVVAALDRLEGRKALVHTQLRDAVGEATTKLEARFDIAGAVRPPAPARWPRLEELTMRGSQGLDAEALRRSAPRPGAACTR
jgi:hypothetical protein